MDLSLMKSLEPREISHVIEKAMLFGGKVMQQGAIHNHQSYVTRIEISADGKILLTIQQNHSLDRTGPIIVNLAYRNLVFRANANQFEIVGNLIICTPPKEAKALSLRDGERFILPHHSGISAFIHRIEKRHSLNDLEARIIDISKRGLGLHLQGIPEGAFCKYDHLWIKKMYHHNLETPLFGRIQYVAERKFLNNRGDLRIGLALDKELPENVFQELIKMSGLILSA
jgi:hypothetical protein